MEKRGGIGWTLVGIVIALAFLSIWQAPLNWVQNALGTAEEVTTCGQGSVEGVCETSCDEGWVPNSAYECPQAGKKCCIPKDVSQEEEERKKQFARFVRLLQQCYQDEAQGKCDTAANLVYELIPQQSNFIIVFYRQGPDILVDFYEKTGDSHQIVGDDARPIERVRMDEGDLRLSTCSSSATKSIFYSESFQIGITIDTATDEGRGTYEVMTTSEATFTDDTDATNFKGFQLEGENWLDFSTYQDKRICIPWDT